MKPEAALRSGVACRRRRERPAAELHGKRDRSFIIESLVFAARGNCRRIAKVAETQVAPC
jgi:hypothetical protein